MQEAERLREEAKGEKDAAITRAEGEAEAAKIRAEGESEALRLVNKVLTGNPDLIQYKYIEKLGPNIEVMLLPANSPYLLDLQSLTNQPPDPQEPRP
jgi:regulator of protease activity HflC (stomatin/prohibitin superfamily)